jgi:hypothetical protein
VGGDGRITGRVGEGIHMGRRALGGEYDLGHPLCTLIFKRNRPYNFIPVHIFFLY